jgi:hypothetical protein
LYYGLGALSSYERNRVLRLVLSKHTAYSMMQHSLALDTIQFLLSLAENSTKQNNAETPTYDYGKLKGSMNKLIEQMNDVNEELKNI